MEDTRIHSRTNTLYPSNNFKDMKDIINTVRVKFKNEIAYTIKNKAGENEDISYERFANEIDALGTALVSIGLKGKKIAVISENRYEWGLTYFATVNGVGVIVPLDRSLPEQEIISCLERSEVEAVFFSDKYNKVMEKVKADKNNNVRFLISMDLEEKNEEMYSQKELINLGKELIANGSRVYIDEEIDVEKMAVMLFTSGTTSQSKVVMLSQKNIITNVNDITQLFDLRLGDVLLSFLPLHHTYECTVGFIYPISVGCRITFCRGIRHIAEDIKLNKITAMISVPVLFESIYKQIIKGVEKEGKLKKFKFGLKLSNFLMSLGIDRRRKIFKEVHENLGGNLRIFVAGAAAFDPEIERKLNEIGIETYQGYGATENSPVIACEHKNCCKPGSVGKLIPNVEGKLVNVDENGIGEIVIKSPSVMLGYYNNFEANSEVLKDGWLYTGDLGYFDDEDYIFLTGRKKNVIVLKNGKNIYPEEIESLIDKIEGVKECFVYGKPDKDDEVDLKIATKVVYDKDYMKEKLNLEKEEDIKAFIWKEIKEINKTMPTYKYIKDLTITSEAFEKTTTQKIKRYEEMKKI